MQLNYDYFFEYFTKTFLNFKFVNNVAFILYIQ